MDFEQVSLKNIQTQQQTLSAVQRRSLEVLQMPLLKLTQYIEQCAAENPLLDIETAVDEDGGNIFDSISMDEGINMNIQESGVDDAESFKYLWERRQGATNEYAYNGSGVETFAEMLRSQLGAMKIDAALAELCYYLIDCLNPRGYLDTGTAVLASELGCSELEVLQALHLVQSLEPAGVGARTLVECLLLQLAGGNRLNSATIKLVNEGLHLVASDDVAAVSRLLQLNPKEAREAIRTVRALNPIPSRGYYTGEQYEAVIPDAVIRREEGTLHVNINQSTIHKLSINEEYRGLIGKTDDKETELYLRDKLNSARLIIRSIEQRMSTLTRVITHLVYVQRDYFETGRGLIPMSMADAAEALDMHTSTISRAIQEKYVVCGKSVIALKSLFNRGVPGNAGQIVPTTVAKQQLAQLIAKENAGKPLSDESLRLALQALGTDISRRTVMKYREELGFASSIQRRRK